MRLKSILGECVPRLLAIGVPPFLRSDRRFALLRPASCFILAAGVTLCPPALAASETKNVLVLYSNGRLLPANVEADRGIRETIRSSEHRPVVVFDEFLDAPRFGGPDYVHTLAAFLREKYASRPPDVIVAGSDEALHFLLQNRATLFPRVPVVHMAVFLSFLRSIPPLPADVVGVPLDPDFSATIAQALSWHPQARRLVIVTGAAARDREFETQLREKTARFKDRATLEFLAGLPTDAVLKRLGELGGDAVVFTTSYFQDGEGRNTTPREIAKAMAAASTAPVYGPFNTFIDTGVVGGYMTSFAAMGRQAGQSVSALLDGAAPASLRLPATMPTTLNLDWRQVQRWGIAEKTIPEGAVVHFRAPTLLEAHRNEAIIAAAVFLIQAGLIAWLLVERRRRRTAERAVAKQRFELAHASRLQIAAELTGSIAHEINQPLGAILSNADAADMILESGADRREEVRSILADIRRDDLRASQVIERLRALLARHEVERRPFELDGVVRDVEAILRTETRRRRVTLDIRLAATSVTLVGDRIQMQQVLINLLLNAMDAVADAPEDRRTVVLSVGNLAGSVAITVRDRGNGIAPEHLPKLFDSFFSTKSEGMGLGLSISRTLVEAHGGRIWAENGAGDGAAFHVELPTAGGAAMTSPGPA